MNHIIIWKDIRLFRGSNNRTVIEHKHPVIQFVVASNGEFMTRVQQTNKWIKKKGLLIKPNHPHQCDATNVPIISMDIEPDSAFGTAILANSFDNGPILDYPSENFKKIDFKNIDCLIKAQHWNDVYNYLKDIFLLPNIQQVKNRDKRIDSVVVYIHENIQETLSTEKLMQVAYLSESRMLHMFKEQLGLPIRNYILWYRLKVAFEKAMKGSSLTSAAHMAGFSDQAHFTRTCTKMIGIPPSIITKNSKFVQVSFPNSL